MQFFYIIWDESVSYFSLFLTCTCYIFYSRKDFSMISLQLVLINRNLLDKSCMSISYNMDNERWIFQQMYLNSFFKSTFWMRATKLTIFRSLSGFGLNIKFLKTSIGEVVYGFIVTLPPEVKAWCFSKIIEY